MNISGGAIIATFYNQATLSYNGNVTTSNITTGELLEVLSATKTALIDTYTSNDNVTYIINIINSGTTAFNGLTITDNLGSTTATVSGAPTTVYPLTYVTESAQYYVNGVRQTDPSATVNPGVSVLTVTGTV